MIKFGKSEMSEKCLVPDCGQTFETQDELRHHLSTIHAIGNIITMYERYGRIEDLLTLYSYSEIKQIAKENNIRVSGSKANMISELIRLGVL